MIDLTADELCDILDCISNRIDDLQDCAMFGDGVEIETEIERMHALLGKVGNALEATNNG